MSIIIRLQNLSWSANSLDIRRFFQGLIIPEGGVHIVGGEKGDAFIAFATDEDARQAMEKDGGKLKEMKIKLMLSSRAEMQRVIEQARTQTLMPAVVTISSSPPPQVIASKDTSSATNRDHERSKKSPEKRRSDRSSREKSRDRERERSSKKSSSRRSRSRSPRRRDKDRENDRRSSKRDERRKSEERTRPKEENSRTEPDTLKRPSNANIAQGVVSGPLSEPLFPAARAVASASLEGKAPGFGRGFDTNQRPDASWNSPYNAGMGVVGGDSNNLLKGQGNPMQGSGSPFGSSNELYNANRNTSFDTEKNRFPDSSFGNKGLEHSFPRMQGKLSDADYDIPPGSHADQRMGGDMRNMPNMRDMMESRKLTDFRGMMDSRGMPDSGMPAGRSMMDPMMSGNRGNNMGAPGNRNMADSGMLGRNSMTDSGMLGGHDMQDLGSMGSGPMSQRLGQSDISGFPDSRSMGDHRNMPDPRGMPNTRGMPDMRGIQDSRGAPDMRGMQDSRVPTDMRGMQDSRGPPDMRGMQDSRGPPDMRAMQDSRGPPDMRGMQDSRGPLDMRGMQDSRGPPDMRGMPDLRGVPDMRGMPDSRGPPDMRGMPDSRGPPDMRRMPDSRATGNVRGISDSRGTTDMRGMSDSRGGTGMRGMPDSRGAPDMRGLSDPRGTPDMRGMPDSRGPPDMRGMPDSRGMPDPRGMQDARVMSDMRGMSDSRGMPDPRRMADSRGIPDSRDLADTRALSDSRRMMDTRGNADSRGISDTRGMRDQRALQNSREVSDTKGMAGGVESRDVPESRDPSHSQEGPEQRRGDSTQSAGFNNKKNTDPDQRTCVEMRGLPLFVVYSDIREFFRGITIPADGIKIINNEQGQRTGVAYVRFQNERDRFEGLKKTGNRVETNTITLGRVSYKTFDEAVDSFLPPGMDPPKPVNRSKKEDTCVLMKGLPFMCKESDIADFFSGINIVDMFIEYDATGRSRGMAFVEFSAVTDVKEAMTRNGKSMGRRYIELSITSKEVMESVRAQMTPEKSPMPPVNMEPLVTHCLAVHGLPFNVIDRQLADFFGEVGYIPHAIHMMLGPNGKPTGDAYIEFNSPKECEAGLKRNGHMFGSQAIQLVPIPYQEMMGILNGAGGPPLDIQPEKIPGPDAGRNTRGGKPLIDSPILNSPRGPHDNPRNAMERPRGPDSFLGPADNQGAPENFHGHSDMQRGHPDNLRGHPDPFRGHPDGPRGRPDGPRGRPDGPRGHLDGPRGHLDSPRSLPDGSRGPMSGPRGHPESFAGHSDSLLGPMEGPPGASRGGLLDRGRPLLDDVIDRGRPPLLDSRDRMMMDPRGPHRDGPFGEADDMMDDMGRPPMGELGRSRRHMDAKHNGRPLLDIEDAGHFMHDDHRMHDDLPRGRMHDSRGYGDHGSGLPEDHPDHMGHHRLPPGARGSGPKPYRGRAPGPPMGMRNQGPSGPEGFGRPGCVMGATNIPWRATMDDILSFFGGFGLSQENVIRRYDALGRPTGDARVCFHTPDDMQRALNQLNGLEIGGRIISLFMP